VDERFVPLYIDDDFSRIGGRCFRYTIGSGDVIRPGHANVAAETSCRFEHTFVIRRDEHARQITGHAGAFVYVLDHGFGGKWGENFAGKTGGSKSRRNDAQDFTRHRRSYHKTPMLDLGKKKGWGAAMLPSLRNILLLSAISVGVHLGASQDKPVVPKQAA